jgi:actin related protein 2/3 complex subunit 5
MDRQRSPFDLVEIFGWQGIGRSQAFRKIDIDAYDEDAFLESELFEPDPRSPAQVLSDAKQKQAAVRGSLAKGDTVGALTVALADAPYGPGVEEAKNLTLQSVVSILNSTKATEIPNVVKSMSQDAQDTLMKYLYKGMGLPGWGDVSGSVLLGWHEKLTEAAGTGCIVRAMTDRRTV